MSFFISDDHQVCHLHPTNSVTGFCAACLRQRLHSLHAAAASLRRCNSSSLPSAAGAAVSSSSSVDQRRRSCDARPTLLNLFHQHDGVARSHCPNGGRDLGFSISVDGDEIRPVDLGVEDGSVAGIEERRHLGAKGASFMTDRADVDVESCCSSHKGKKPSVDVREMEERWQLGGRAREMKAMKDHIDIELESSSSSQQQGQGKKISAKDLRELAGSFKSMFCKKIQNWRKKQKLSTTKCNEASTPAEKLEKTSCRFRHAQSEIGLDMLGRRSCDVDPRFSVEAGRTSMDGIRDSLDEPRASWDGYLFGGRSVFPRLNPMMPVVENTNAASVHRSDGLIPVEEDNTTPGGSAQTREYYLHSSSRRRRSLDRSSSIREQAVEFNELRSIFNAKVTPAGGTEFFHTNQGGLINQELKDWRSNSLRDDYFGSFESVVRDLSKGAGKKKSGMWNKSWNVFGFLHRRGSNKEAVDRTDSDSWANLRCRSYNGKVSHNDNKNGPRHSFSSDVGYGGMKRSSLNISGNATKKRGEFVLDRNRSARYSPSHNDNGLLRFYLTPIRNGRGNSGGSGNSRRISSQYIKKTMLGLY